MATSKLRTVEKGIIIPVGLKLNEEDLPEIKKAINQWVAQNKDKVALEIQAGIDRSKMQDEIKAAFNEFNKFLSKNHLPLIDMIDLDGAENQFAKLGQLMLKNIQSSFDAKQIGTAITSAVNESVTKSISQIEDATKRIGKSFTKIGFSKSKTGEIHRTNVSLKSNYQQAFAQLEDEFAKRQSINESPYSPWEQRYSADIRFAEIFEKFSKKFTDKPIPNEISAVYKQLADTVVIKRDMLQNIVNMKTMEKPTFVGYDTGEPWARESTLQEVKNLLSNGVKNDQKASKDYTQLKNKRQEEQSAKTKAQQIFDLEDIVSSFSTRNEEIEENGKTIADVLEQTAIELEKLKKEFLKLTGIKFDDVRANYEKQLGWVAKPSSYDYIRTVHPPEENEGKFYSQKYFGAEYYYDSSKDETEQYKLTTKNGYGEDTIKAIATPLNELRIKAPEVIIDAEGNVDQASLERIHESELLDLLFPGIQDFIHIGQDKNQKFYNELAKQAGFDVLRIDDLVVGQQGDEKLYGDEIAVLQKSILSYQTKPDYYETDQLSNEERRALISQQRVHQNVGIIPL